MDTTDTTDTETKVRIVTLSSRPPVKIKECEWPVIASSSWCDDPRVPQQANRKAWLKVRQHADGRTLVYGGTESNWERERSLRSGLLCPKGSDVAKAIYQVSEELGYKSELAADAVGELPAEEI